MRVAELALAETDDALRTTANPIRLERAPDRGRTWVLSAQVQAYALALTLAFLTLLLSAGALAAERDENVLGRLARWLVRLWELVAAKVALAAVVAVVLGLAIALAFGIAIEAGDVTGGRAVGAPAVARGRPRARGREPGRARLPARRAGARGADGVARRSARRAADRLPRPRAARARACGRLDQRRAPVRARGAAVLSSALYDASPWATVAVEAAWLAGLGLLFGALARLGMGRLVSSEAA